MLFPFPHFGKVWSFLVGLTVLATPLYAAPLELTVSKADSIQVALDSCPEMDGCVIRLKAGTYELSNSLLLRNKENVRITGSGESSRPVLRFQDDGSLAGPDNNPDTLALKPKGWKRWPLDWSNQVGGSGDRTNPYSKSGIQMSGVFLILNCRKITMDSIVIDGKAPIGWGSLGVWSRASSTFYGNFGLNLSYSQDVLVRNSEFRNCFAGVYVKGVSITDTLNSMKSLREKIGGHVFEGNNFHHNIWAAFRESNSGRGLIWRFNRIWENHNDVAEFLRWTGDYYGKSGAPTFNRENVNGAPVIAMNLESTYHAGGFLFIKDTSAIDSIYNNTLWNNYRVVGNDLWGSNRFVLINNVIADPWLGYNSDTTGYQSLVYPKGYAKDLDVILFSSAGMRSPSVFKSNTFAVFPRITISGPEMPGRCYQTKDACKYLRDSLQNELLPKQRFYAHLTTVIPDRTYRIPVKVPYDYVVHLTYMGEMNFRNSETGIRWGLETLSGEFAQEVKTIPLLGSDDLVHSYEYYPVDTAAIEKRFNYFSGKPAPDTLGRILQITSPKLNGDSALDNFYIKSIPFVLDSSRPDFLAPVWSDYGVDSVILGKAWAPAGETAPLARGAVQPMSLVPTPKEPEPVVGLDPNVRKGNSVRLASDGSLIFADSRMQGLCRLFALDGQLLGEYRVSGGRSARVRRSKGAFLVRWQQSGVWMQASLVGL